MFLKLAIWPSTAAILSIQKKKSYIFHTTAFLFYSAIKTRLVVRIPPKSERKNTPKAPWCSHIEPYQSSNTYKHSYIWDQTEFNRLQKVTMKIVGVE